MIDDGADCIGEVANIYLSDEYQMSLERCMKLEPTGTPMLMGTLAKFSLNTDIRHGVAIVSHNADRSGAPLIALNIAGELLRARAIPVVTISLEPGEMEPEFARLGPLFAYVGNLIDVLLGVRIEGRKHRGQEAVRE